MASPRAARAFITAVLCIFPVVAHADAPNATDVAAPASVVKASVVKASVAKASDTKASSGPDESAAARAEMDATLAQMKDVARRVRDMLRETRKRGTSVQVTCVDEALSRADVALRDARAASEASLLAYARSDVKFARDARFRVLELREHQRVAARDGTACRPLPLGAALAPAAVSTVTTVRMTVDPRLPSPSLDVP